MPPSARTGQEMSLDHTDRRRILTAGILLPVGLLTAGGTVGASTTSVRTDIDTGVAGIVARWESTNLVDVLNATHHWAYLCRQLGSRGRDWQLTTGRVALLSARAHADLGETTMALAEAQKARVLGRACGDTATEAEATLVAAEVHDAATPTSAIPLQMTRAARRRAGTSWLGVAAASIEAAILARGGPGSASDVIDVLRDADTAARLLPEPRPGEFSPGQLAAFGGCALIRAGRPDEATDRLSDAVFDEHAAPGMASAVLVYRASAAVAGRRFDEGAALAGRALDVSAQRPTAWLAASVRGQAQTAGGKGGYDALVGRLGGWPAAATV